MNSLRVLPYGPRALLVETDHPTTTADVLRSLDGVEEIVPGACTVLVLHDGRRHIDADIANAASQSSTNVASSIDGPVVVIDVVYDGVDLDDVATRIGLDVGSLVDLHSSAEYEVAFCGFAPGFAYLSGLPDGLHVPRRDTPRTRVPAGSVAIAGPYAAVYPTASPGGWNLLGHTDATVWDVTVDPPALLTPGTRVRFRPVEARPVEVRS